MLNRYTERFPLLHDVGIPEINELMPINSQHKSILYLLEKLNVVGSFIKKLQSNNSEMLDVRELFVAVIKTFPQTKCRRARNVRIISHVQFENAVVEIQDRRIYDVTVNELDALSKFLHCKVDRPNNLEELLFAEQFVKKRILETTGEVWGYVNTAFLIPRIEHSGSFVL